MRRIFTVDSNYLRRNDLRALAHDPDAHTFIVPDLVMFEQVKPEHRESTFRSSLRILSEIPDRVVIGRSVSELLRHELATREAIQDFAIFREATPVMRLILEAVRHDATNEVLDEILNDPTNHIPALIEDHLDHEENRRRAHLFQYETFEQQFSREFHRRLRRNEVGDDELALVTKHGSVQLCFYVLRNHWNFSDKEALDLINAQGVVMRYHYVKFWIALKLSVRDQLRNRRADEISNDNVDAHNAIIGSQHGNFLTLDALAASASEIAHQMATDGIRYRLDDANGQISIVPI